MNKLKLLLAKLRFGIGGLMINEQPVHNPSQSPFALPSLVECNRHDANPMSPTGDDESEAMRSVKAKTNRFLLQELPGYPAGILPSAVYLLRTIIDDNFERMPLSVYSCLFDWMNTSVDLEQQKKILRFLQNILEPDSGKVDHPRHEVVVALRTINNIIEEKLYKYEPPSGTWINQKQARCRVRMATIIGLAMMLIRNHLERSGKSQKLHQFLETLLDYDGITIG